MPTLILLDLVMPVLDGYQFLEERAKNGGLSRLPVILISGQPDAHKAVSTYGLAGYVEKPIGIANLFDALERRTRRGRS
jgi:CheY-like chemotaxis protein